MSPAEAVPIEEIEIETEQEGEGAGTVVFVRIAGEAFRRRLADLWVEQGDGEIVRLSAEQIKRAPVERVPVE